MEPLFSIISTRHAESNVFSTLYSGTDDVSSRCCVNEERFIHLENPKELLSKVGNLNCLPPNAEEEGSAIG